MKITKLNRIASLLIMFGLAGVLVTSCEREVIIEDNVDGLKMFDHGISLEDQTQVKIEYSTPDEINQLFVKNGLPPIDFESKFANKKTSICEIAPFLNSCQCNSWVVASRGDINQNGSLSGIDLVLATKTKNGIIPYNINSWGAGGIENLNGNGNTCSSIGGTISDQDIEIMIFTILGCNC